MPPATLDHRDGPTDDTGDAGDVGDDALVQELYGTALSLQATSTRADATDAVRRAVTDAVSRIDAVIDVLRRRLES